MQLDLVRNVHDKEWTIGEIRIGGVFQCYTLEDEYRAVKVKAETRIPEGVYNIELRTVGGFHEKYLRKFGSTFHKGMLWIKNVPGFEYILIHIGNTEKDTAGCVLVGSTRNVVTGTVGSSEVAYRKLYPVVLAAIQRGEKVTISVSRM